MKITKKALKTVMNAYGEKIIDIYIDEDKTAALVTAYHGGTVSEWFFGLLSETCTQQLLSSVMIHEAHKRPDALKKLVTILNK